MQTFTQSDSINKPRSEKYGIRSVSHTSWVLSKVWCWNYPKLPFILYSGLDIVPGCRFAVHQWEEDFLTFDNVFTDSRSREATLNTTETRTSLRIVPYVRRLYTARSQTDLSLSYPIAGVSRLRRHFYRTRLWYEAACHRDTHFKRFLRIVILSRVRGRCDKSCSVSCSVCLTEVLTAEVSTTRRGFII